MSQIVGIAGAEAESRQGFIANVAPRTPVVSSQKTTRWAFGDVELVCAAAPSAPVSSSSAGTFVLGRWSDDAANAGSQADRLLMACNAGGAAAGRGAGYGFACYVEPSGTVWLGVDILGLFPLYYHADADRLLFSTSPALLTSLESFKPQFNMRGLVGNLLTMHMVGGQTLWKDVRRLAPGYALRWKRGEGATEVPARVLTPSDAHFGETYEKNLDRFDAGLDSAARRESTGASTGMLLSGGLDSRLLVAILRRAIKGPVHCVTSGRASDLEMRIAGRVARRVGWPQHPSEGEWSRFPEIAEKHLAHQQLGVGFNDMAFWFAGETAAAAGATSVFNGAVGDCVMGGNHIPYGFDPKRQTYSFDTLFTHINRYGFTPDEIGKLVRPELLGDTVDAAMTDMRDQYDGCAGLPFQKVWLWTLLNRNRFHIAALAWEVCAGAWAVPAFTGAEMLEAAANMPADSLLGRRAQIDLICRLAPDLAALPQDRNSRTNLAPIRYRSGWQRLWDQKVMGKYRNMLRKLHNRRGIETRYYFRVYDMNNPGWQAIRRAAEPYRKIAETVFQPEALQRLLPPPEVPIRVADGIIDASRIKTLLGFMLWAGKNM